MIYTAVKNYDRALYYFEVSISTPAMAMSHIMLESYKKYILVSLILRGKQITIPKYSSQVIGRFMKPLSQNYHELSNVYVNNGTPDAVRAVITKYQESFNRDNNLGLVKQVLATLYKKKIQRLTKTFLTLSLSDVASRACLSGPAEAEKYILLMASISSKLIMNAETKLFCSQSFRSNLVRSSQQSTRKMEWLFSKMILKSTIHQKCT